MIIPIGRLISDLGTNLGTGILGMWGKHLKRRGNWWHYYRAVPCRYRDVDARKTICFALRTTNFSEAKLRAAQVSCDLERQWEQAKQRGLSLAGQDQVKRFGAAMAIQAEHGLKLKSSTDFTDDELLSRLRLLLDEPIPRHSQTAVLGLIERPDLSMADAFERFWDHIEDEWSALSHDQKRSKRNGYLKALSNFHKSAGDVPMYQVDRRHALEFRKWWLERLKKEGLKPHTGNKDINAIRRLISTNFDMDSIETPNPFARIRLKDTPQVPREPFCNAQIRLLLAPNSMPKLHADFQLLFRLLVNTGMRPVEAIGLELEDVMLDCKVPHVHVRRNSTRGLKTDHSERLLPLLGVSLQAAEELVAMGGWGKRAGKNMYATSIINRYMSASGMVIPPFLMGSARRITRLVSVSWQV